MIVHDARPEWSKSITPERALLIGDTMAITPYPRSSNPDAMLPDGGDCLVLDIREIKRRVDICEVWAALGGRELRRLRGQAFWRGGNGYNVALNPSRGTWHDYVTGDGGDVIALVQIVRRCGFLAATQWLAGQTGVRMSKRIARDRDAETGWACDLRWANWWSLSAERLGEWALEELPCDHPERRGLTQFIRELRLGDASRVSLYREWRQRNPNLTHAMARAGRSSDARVQRQLAHGITERDRA
jgi:hypothetical protein